MNPSFSPWLPFGALIVLAAGGDDDLYHSG
jgi:hypothetical protein